MTATSTYHIPVLLDESIDGLSIHPSGVYVDVTFGGGGHSTEIMKRLGPNGHLYGFDQDADAERNVIHDNRFTFVHSNFRYLKNFLRYYGVMSVNGILADLGVSSHHFDEQERGFSFRFDGALDMRMNRKGYVTASDIVNTYNETDLAEVFTTYGELRNGCALARHIVKCRERKKIATINDLLGIITPLLAKGREKKELAKVFQALRIKTNDEMEALRELLTSATEVLAQGGRLVVITYHSLEDRMVKNLMKTGNTEGIMNKDLYGNRTKTYHIINNRVIVPSEAEMERNPRSRSAKLRIAEKL